MQDRITPLIDELDALRASRNDHWQIPRAEGDLLYHIALSTRAKKIVEVGTSYGFSGLFWAKVLQHTGGDLHTIDRDPKKVESSRETFARAGVGSIVHNHLGDAQEVLAGITGPLCIAFIDADKPATRAYFDRLWALVRVGGCIITDNIVSHRDQMADFVKHLRARPDASSVEVAVGNGIEWTIKLG